MGNWLKRVPHSKSLFSRHREQKHRLQGPGLALHRLSVCGLFENPGNVAFSIRCIQNACAAAAFVQKRRSQERLVIVTANHLGCFILISTAPWYTNLHTASSQLQAAGAFRKCRLVLLAALRRCAWGAVHRRVCFVVRGVLLLADCRI